MTRVELVRVTGAKHEIVVIGAGLAGSEAAWQAAERGASVLLYEMRPGRMTAAHQTSGMAELVCSNSLGSDLPDRALGVLKQELRRLGSLIIRVADQHAVPAGGALAVDRDAFSAGVTAEVEAHPRITVVREEVLDLPQGQPTVVATGPLTSASLAEVIRRMSGDETLYFFDAMAPIVSVETVDMSIAFRQSRYAKSRPSESTTGAQTEAGPDAASGESEGDYTNCPLNKDEYLAFVQAVNDAEKISLREFEQTLLKQDDESRRYFEGCLPIEVLAARDPMALAFGPMRPVGLRDPRTGRRPFAAVQLRQDNAAGTLYNLVGFQTNIKWGDQERVLRMIPGLANAEFVRFGQMHRNTFINSPKLLRPTLQWGARDDLLFAGQLTGTEGYVGSSASGLIAGLNAWAVLAGQQPVELPVTTMTGALLHYITHADPATFQPMKANFGLLPELDPFVRDKRRRYAAYAERARADLETAIQRTPWLNGGASGGG
jgi:methylenetetrahydrofolate--tRNA-(uracil-5-)-methyltransferase